MRVCVRRRLILGAGLGVTLFLAAIIPFVAVAVRQSQMSHVTKTQIRVAKETFSQTLGIVCHELRNPVHALQGMLTMFREDYADVLRTGMKRDLGAITMCARTMQLVLDDVVEMQRCNIVSVVLLHGIVVSNCVSVEVCCGGCGAQTSFTVKPTPTLLSNLIRDVANSARNDMNPGVKFSVAIDKTLPEKPYMLDQARMRLVNPFLSSIVFVLATPLKASACPRCAAAVGKCD